MKNRLILYYFLVQDVIILDQLTKIVASIYAEDGYELSPFLSFEFLINRGISWGLFQASQSATIYFSLMTLLIAILTAGVTVYGVKRHQQGFRIYGELLIISGSISNLADRVLFLGVRDFILLHWGNYQWPVFNVADIAIVFGVMIMSVQQIKES